jgi:hypothetical protein
MRKHSYVLAQFGSLAPHEGLFSEFLCQGLKPLDKLIGGIDVVNGDL